MSYPQLVHVVEVFDRADGVYVFADLLSAERFQAAVHGDSIRRRQTVCGPAETDRLIASERDES